MSDCSTQAMKPKEPHPTFDLHECVDCEHYCADCNTCCKGVPDHQDCMFPCWTPSRAHLLEQVARDMYAALHVNESCSLEFIADKGDCETFRARLEALGVSVDG